MRKVGVFVEGPEFKASDGWLRSLLRRNSLKTHRMRGEAASADQSVIDYYSSTETGLNYLDEGRTTLELSSSKVSGSKKRKERLTILLCCSLMGEKYVPLFIGESGIILIRLNNYS